MQTPGLRRSRMEEVSPDSAPAQSIASGKYCRFTPRRMAGVVESWVSYSCSSERVAARAQARIRLLLRTRYSTYDWKRAGWGRLCGGGGKKGNPGSYSTCTS